MEKNTYAKKEPDYPKEVDIYIRCNCNQLASETTEIIAENGTPEGITPLLQPPYPGSRAMLKIGRRWITSNYKRHLYSARWAPPVRAYMKAKYEWSDEIFDSVDWPAIG